ncbi:MAG TPA: hypothetical protein VD905_20330 [Flavobacteriales bacterium]|nr:hypothetical protein [Flavobacteriales bacterium]
MATKKTKRSARNNSNATKKTKPASKKKNKATAGKKQAGTSVKKATRKKKKTTDTTKKKTPTKKTKKNKAVIGRRSQRTVQKRARPKPEKEKSGVDILNEAGEDAMQPESEATHEEQDVHFPPKAETYPVNATQKHKAETKFHTQKETAFIQENKKVNAALSSRRNLARQMRSRGRR